MGILANQGRPDLPGWGIGQWGLEPWDSILLPGNILGTVAFNLKLANLGNYPSGAWTAEIQSRDLTDRVNYTFTTYAKLNQILADGNLSITAGIIIVGTDIYISTAPTWFVDQNVVSPTKVCLYKLTSIDSENIGVFELIGSKSVNPIQNENWQWHGNGYMPGVANTIGVGLLYAFGYMDGQFSETFMTFNDYNGDHTVYHSQTMHNILWLVPYDASLESCSIVNTEISINRIATVSTYSGNPDLGANPAAYQTILSRASWSMTYDGITGMGIGCNAVEPVQGGWDESCRYTPHLNQTGAFILKSHWEGSNYKYEPVFAHPISFNKQCPYALFWGTLLTKTNWDQVNSTGSMVSSLYLLDQASRSIRPRVSIALSGPDALVGIWGDTQALVIHRNNWIVNYSSYYVIKASDPSATHQWSIFSALQEDGSVVHLEGLEDPTPSLWIDLLKVMDLN